jgi:hypothetical protein
MSHPEYSQHPQVQCRSPLGLGPAPVFLPPRVRTYLPAPLQPQLASHPHSYPHQHEYTPLTLHAKPLHAQYVPFSHHPPFSGSPQSTLYEPSPKYTVYQASITHHSSHHQRHPYPRQLLQLGLPCQTPWLFRDPCPQCWISWPESGVEVMSSLKLQWKGNVIVMWGVTCHTIILQYTCRVAWASSINTSTPSPHLHALSIRPSRARQVGPPGCLYIRLAPCPSW